MAAPPPDAPDPNAGVSFAKFAGLKNTVSPERLDPNELAVALNVDIDDRQQVRRRRGFQPFGAWHGLRCHSLFQTGDDRVFCAYESAPNSFVLGEVFPDGITSGDVTRAVSDRPISYTQVADAVYWSSATHNGVINLLPGREISFSPWGHMDGQGFWLSPVVNPTPTLAPIAGRLLGDPPLAAETEYWNGRIYLAAGRVLWATELYGYHYVDKTKNYKYFESEIQVVGAVTDGIYVGCEDQIFWLEGQFNEMRRLPLMSAGAIKGSLVRVPAELVNPQVPQDQYTDSKNAVVFMTDRGLVAGLDGGKLFNLTWTEFQFPAAQSAAALFRQLDGVNQYVGVLESGGDPVNASRFGDFVEADIRRAGDWGNLADAVRFHDEFAVDKV